MNNTSFSLIGLFLLLIFSTSCKKDKKEIFLKEEIIADAAYGNQPKQTMDVYLPQGRNAQTPLIVLLHGGAFVGGDKADFSQQSQQLMAKGYAVINVNYRLVDINGLLKNPPEHRAGDVHISTQLQDIKAAVNYAEEHAEAWKVNPDRWAIAGHSAGGTLALLYAYGDLNSAKKIKAAANWAGVLDFSYEDESEPALLNPLLPELLYRIANKEPTNENKAAFKAISPYYIATAGHTVPTISIRPEFNVMFNIPDLSKPAYQALNTLLNSQDIPNKLIEVSGADHDFTGTENWNLVINKTAGFFAEQLIIHREY